MNIIKPLIITVSLSLCIFGSANSQEITVAQLTESDFFSDFPVVLTATRLKQSKKNSPIATSIIDREMIEASGFTEIVDLLRLAPGMLVNYDSGHIGNAGYQFLFHRYTVRFQVLVDGRSVYTPLRGEMPWTQLGITIDDIERIEVIRGPSSSSYGPNAMTGVVSIITRDAVLDKGLKIKFNEGKKGRSEHFFTVGSSSGNFDYKLSLGARKDDGFDQRHDSKELGIANFRGDYQATSKDTVSFLINHSSGDYQEDSTFDSNLPLHEKNITQTSYQLKWERNLKDNNSFSLNYYHQEYDDDNSYFYTFGPGGLLSESVFTKRDNIEFTHSIVNDALKFTWGALLRRDVTTAPHFLYQVTNDTVDTKQLFINSEYAINDNNNINIGMLADNNDTAGSTQSYRVSLNHHVSKSDSIRVSYSTSTRSPFVFEEYTNYFVPDFGILVSQDLGDLSHEEAKSIDFGILSSLNNNKTELDLRIHKTELSNIIVYDNDFGEGHYEGDSFNVSGVELGIKHRLSNNTRAVFNYARTKIDAKKLINITEASWYETGAPNDIASLLLIHKFGNGYGGSLGYYYTGTYQQICCEEQQQQPRRRLDLTLAKSFKLQGYNSKLKLVLQNVTDEEIITENLNNYDRQGYLSFSMEL